jgi:hypothetical protein
MARFEVPEGMTVQAFQFALDLTPEQAACMRRQFGGRRYAYNWAVRTMKADIAAYHADRTGSPPPSMIGMRKVEPGQGRRVRGCRHGGSLVAANIEGGVRRDPRRQAHGLPAIQEEGP